ncbi:probable flavoprotein involved in K+ transport [Fusarium fujikuroi]|nr:probable flavoprotein involved in K+ transport [Fusarium fujikuroi]
MAAPTTPVVTTSLEESPPCADLRETMADRPLPAVTPGIIDEASMAGAKPTEEARAVLDRVNAALVGNDSETLKDCFLPGLAHWKDTLAMTYHLRTLFTPGVIVAGLLKTKDLRGIAGGLTVEGTAQFVSDSETPFISSDFVYRTISPAASCTGTVYLIPTRDDNEVVEWKIWVLSTRLESLDIQHEDMLLLNSPGKPLDGLHEFDTDVFIIGGGNAGLALAARLKALGVESVISERNDHVGDNWALRYDCLQFHVPTSFCDLPYKPYGQEFRSVPLKRDVLAEQLKLYVEEFQLNIVTESSIQWTAYDSASEKWKIRIRTPRGEMTATARHLVQATGVASQKPYLPLADDAKIYKGFSLHSSTYKNPAQLQEKGIKSVLIIGSANTAFDILQDSHAAGLETTMVVRSPTYIVPLEYITDPRSLGVYDSGVEAADRRLLSLPLSIDAALGKRLFTKLAEEEPDRYKSLAAAGFPVLDSTDKDCVLAHNLLERAGGHYVDTGATSLIADGKVGVKANVQPIAFIEKGLRFSDGSTLHADAIIWCTGFCDKDVRQVAAEVFGVGQPSDEVVGLGLEDILARMDSTWGIDSEGEIRGMWKRQSKLANFWVMGGHTQLHRWHSKTLALQIKAALEGVLPDPWLDTPATTE